MSGTTIRTAFRTSVRDRENAGLAVLVATGLALVVPWTAGVFAAGVTTVRVLLVLNVGLALINVVLVPWLHGHGSRRVPSPPTKERHCVH